MNMPTIHTDNAIYLFTDKCCDFNQVCWLSNLLPHPPNYSYKSNTIKPHRASVFLSHFL